MSSGPKPACQEKEQLPRTWTSGVAPVLSCVSATNPSSYTSPSAPLCVGLGLCNPGGTTPPTLHPWQQEPLPTAATESNLEFASTCKASRIAWLCLQSSDSQVLRTSPSSSETPALTGVVPPPQRLELQLCKASPLSLYMLTIPTSSLCSLSPKVGSCFLQLLPLCSFLTFQLLNNFLSN